MRYIFIILLYSILQLNVVAHELYISLTNIEYDEQEQIFNVSTKLDAEHFFTILNKDIDKSFVFNVYNSFFLTKEYLSKNFIIRANDNTFVNINFKNFHNRDTNLFLEYSFSLKDNTSYIYLTNTLLFDYFNQQENFVNFVYKSVNQQFVFKPSKSTYLIKLA